MSKAPAFADQPAHVFWRELAYFYPDAKVLLTVRNSSDRYDSYRATIWGPTVGPTIDKGMPDERWNEMVRRVLGVVRVTPLQLGQHASQCIK